MKLAIVGSQSFEQNEENLEYMIEKIDHYFDLDNIDTVISGGVDTFAEDFHNYLVEDSYSVELDVKLPAFKKYDHINYHVNHYFERNAKIAEKCDGMIAFWDGESTGTEDAIEQAKLNKKPVKVVYFEQDSITNA